MGIRLTPFPGAETGDPAPADDLNYLISIYLPILCLVLLVLTCALAGKVLPNVETPPRNLCVRPLFAFGTAPR